MRVAGWAGPGAVHVGPAADPGPAGSSGRCGGWGGRRWRPGPGAASAPGYRAGGVPRVPATHGLCSPFPAALAAPTTVSPVRAAAAAPGERTGASAGCGERGERRHRAGTEPGCAPSGGGDGRGGLPRSWK